MSNTIRDKKIFTDSASSFTPASIGLPGTSNRIVKFSGSGLASSSLLDNGTTIAIDANKYFTSSSGVSRIDLQNSYLSIRINTSSSSMIYLDNTVLSLLDHNGNVGLTLVSDATNPLGFDSAIIVNSDVLNSFSSPNNTNLSGVFINSQNGTFNGLATNSVILGGNSLYALSSNTTYVQQLGYGIDGVNETIVTFAPFFGTNTVQFPSFSGTLALTSDLSNYLPLSGGTMAGNIDITGFSLYLSNPNCFLNYAASELSLYNSASRLSLLDTGAIVLNASSSSPISFQINTNDILVIDSAVNTSYRDFTIATGYSLTLGNTAVTGLTPGVEAALTNATITIKDETGQVYRIPCIV